MGVPKFFRYTSERYPCLNELVKQYQIPDFDHMYLDMNGIIHNCSHPDDSNPHFRITEEKIFEDIFHYISILFQIIKPKKLFFMAIDGVAPRAKMNQQRGRRFRSAREAEKLEDEAKAKGETLPTEKRFDSNCITPGTVFMARLHEQLRFFVKRKITHDPLWSKVKVVLSGHETPGEGEHKIMDYIRWARSQPEYDPNTRHCLYGLDADLIMLGTCTHEPHFALLREEVKFGRQAQRVTSPEETNFYLLHLSLLKEYLEQEFIEIKDKLPFPYDIEKIVDDWVLMGFLVGNDFIPHLPNMHIGNEAVPLLYKTYMKVLPTLSGYINEAGELNLERFEIFMQELAKIDKEMFQETFVDLQYFEAKTGRRPNANDRKEHKPNDDETFNVNIDDIKAQPDDDLQALINATDELFLDDEALEGDSSDDDGPIGDVEAEFKLHKRDYYMTKLDYSNVTEEVLADQAEGYVRAIQWNLYYYYKGCPSWCWYYPHHYAPYMSDIKGFKDLKIEFELGEPFKPFEQLLAVLPAASKHLLPAPFHDLMTDEDSAIVHYYPVNFETDLNGKINDWEAVVLIPFIDEINLLSAMAPCYQRLTEEELKRNTHGPMLVYNWIASSQGPAIAPEYFPSVEECHALELFVWRKDLEVPPSQLKNGVLPNARTDMLYPGFPTMRHLKYKTALKNARVRVFDQPSRNNSMMVEIINEEKPILDAVAAELLGKVIWVGWPHLTRAKVVTVSDEKRRLHHVDQQNNNIDNQPPYTTEFNEGNLHQQWISERSTVVEHNHNRLGIVLGPVKIIVHAVNHKGYKYIIQDNSKMAIEPEFCTIPCGYALQATVKDVKAYIMEDVGKYTTPQEAFPPGETVFLLTQGQYYGCQAKVVDSESIRSGRIKVTLTEQKEPIPSISSSASPYHIANHAAAACGISAHMLSRITGVVLIADGERNTLPPENLKKTNVGLNLKMNKKNLEVSGYTRKCKVTNTWLYSHRCVALVAQYAEKYPELFDKVSQAGFNDTIFESDIWPQETKEGVKKGAEITAWLKTLPHAKAARRECGSECLEPEEMKSLADCLDPQLKELANQEKKVTMQVKWSLLYKPELFHGNIQPDPKADHKILDRVVCVARNITVPFGAKGTITAIYPAADSNTVRLSDKLNADASYQVLFDEPFGGAMGEEGFDKPRFYRMQTTHILNISFGRKLRDLVDAIRKPNQDALGFTYNQPTNILRRGDGLHSAFASYSPPVDKKPSPFENRISTNQTPMSVLKGASVPDKNGLQPDNATHLLKSLLKISENNQTDTTKKNKNSQEQNWRVKEKNIADLPTPPQPQPTRIQQPTNWRTEQSPPNTVKKPQAGSTNPLEWTNTNYKNQPATIPPFPNFPTTVPGPTQIPFPQFQNPHFNQRNQPPRNQTANPRPNQGFPKHLPTVAGNNVTLGPSWMGQQNSKPAPPIGSSNPNASGQNPNASGHNPNASGHNPNASGHSSADKLSNPFVPLQVQTSRRRTQNSSAVTTKKDSGGIVVPQFVMPRNDQPAPMNAQEPLPNKPQKKKKQRIAANLPFQMD